MMNNVGVLQTVNKSGNLMPMTTTISQPVGTAPDFQNVAVMNIKLMLKVRGDTQKNLAGYMGKNPQSLSRMMRPGYAWTFNDMCLAARYLGTSVDTLMRQDLTLADLMGDNKKPRGGVAAPRLIVKDLYQSSFVAGHGFEPWTSGL